MALLRILLAGTCVLLVGCGGRTTSSILSVPDTKEARAALDASLAVWRDRLEPDPGLIGTHPTIGTVDTQRFQLRLAEYEILGPLAVQDRARPFAVRLVFTGNPQPVETRYLVIGKDPLWVFSRADYERILHWEHPMEADPIDDKSGQIPPESRTNLNE